MSLAGSGLILTTAVLRLFLRRKVPACCWLFLWGAALCRLLIPFSIPTPISLFNLPAWIADAKSSAPMMLTASHTAVGFDGKWLLAAGCIVAAAFFAAGYMRQLSGFRASLPANEATLCQIQAEYPMRRKVKLRVHDCISAPLTYGILRPIILLPRKLDFNDVKTLRFVLAHEYTHIRRFDCLWKFAAAAALCVHWFNPAVWLLLPLLSRDLELSCDAAVIRRFHGSHRAAYARALLYFAEQRCDHSPLISHFSKNPLEERICFIMTSRKHSIAGLALATALIVGTTSAFAAPVDPQDQMQVDADMMQAVTVTAASTSTDADAPSILSFSLDDAKSETLPDGTVVYTLSDGTKFSFAVAAEDAQNIEIRVADETNK